VQKVTYKVNTNCIEEVLVEGIFLISKNNKDRTKIHTKTSL